MKGIRSFKKNWSPLCCDPAVEWMRGFLLISALWSWWDAGVYREWKGQLSRCVCYRWTAQIPPNTEGLQMQHVEERPPPPPRRHPRINPRVQSRGYLLRVKSGDDDTRHTHTHTQFPLYSVWTPRSTSITVSSEPWCHWYLWLICRGSNAEL